MTKKVETIVKTWECRCGLWSRQDNKILTDGLPICHSCGHVMAMGARKLAPMLEYLDAVEKVYSHGVSWKQFDTLIVNKKGKKRTAAGQRENRARKFLSNKMKQKELTSRLLDDII